jgi:hypothetical protein
MPSLYAVIVLLLVLVVPARAATDDTVAVAGADGFHALSRLDKARVAIVPLTCGELSDTPATRTPRIASPSASVRTQQLAHVEDSCAQGPGFATESVAETPDIRASIDNGAAQMERTTPTNDLRTSPARRRELADTIETSRSGEDPRAQARRGEQNSGIKTERRDDSRPPSTRGRPAVAEEPDPRAVIDWLLNDSKARVR